MKDKKRSKVNNPENVILCTHFVDCIHRINLSGIIKCKQKRDIYKFEEGHS